MKTSGIQFPSRSRSRATTLPELMVTMGVFTLVVMGLVSLNMFGLRQDELMNSKLGASDQARVNFNLFLDEIRSGKNVEIGFGTPTNFIPITNGPQMGDTLHIIPSTNPGCSIYYYYRTNCPTNGAWLVRVAYLVSNVAGVNLTNISTSVVAQYVTNMPNRYLTNLYSTNALCFQALTLTGTNWTLLTNDPTVADNHNYIVSTLLQFYQFQYPLTKVGSNTLYDYYQIQLQATRRAL